MDDFTHARRSPAVRARHFGKRMLNDVFPRDGSLPSLSTFSLTAGDFSTDPAFLPLHTSTSDVVQTPEPTSVPVPATTSTLSTTPTPTFSSLSSSSSSTTTTTVTSTVLPTSTASSLTITTSSSSAIVSTPSAGNDVANASGSSSKGISGGAVAAIVTIVIVGLLAIGFFFVRRKYIKNRQSKRGTWGAGVFAKHTEIAPPPPVEKGYSNTPGVGPRYEGGNEALSARAYGGILSYVEDSQLSPPAFGQHVPRANLTPPPMSYNSTDSQSVVHPPSLSPGLGGAAAVGMERTSAVASSNATIKCTFIPSLPDELSITTGETVRVLAEYDDGWAMCVNTRGEQGMVPIECLERGSVEVSENTDWRNSKRTSSLPPARY